MASEIAGYRQTPLPVFVANRISTIQTSLSSAFWNHVSSKQNPADCAPRGLTAEELVNFSLWWKGREWLSRLREAWPQRQVLNVQPESEHLVSAHPVKSEGDTARTEKDWQSELLTRTSSWARLLRITA